jgi:selenoprotein B, glycine/betaine/sarcosine/D-proline reductase family
MSFRVVHYINQFFAQIGGEEMAHIAPELRDGAVGPGAALLANWKGEAEIVKTVVCGDSYFAEHEKDAKEQILGWIKEVKPDMFIAGPAFNAGRYGYACSTIALAVKEELGIPVLTGMYEENPGADLKDKILIVATANSAAGMRKAAPTMANLALKLMKGEKLGASCEDGYMPNGIRVNFFEKERGSKRAVKMLLAKLADRPFTTEYPMPSFDRVAPNPAVKDLSKATIALCTSGGIVPKGNPDHIESSSASHYGEYCIAGVEKLTEATYETAHGGYDPVYANQDPNRVLPVDVMREFEREGKIGKLHDYFYTTVGNGTSVANAKGFAAEYAQKLLKAGVNAVIMTST